MADNKIVEETLSKMELLDKWVSDLIYPGTTKDFMHTLKKYTDEGPDGIQEIREFCFYTEQFKYRIFANDRLNDDGYLGCGVSSRKMRAGETWIRGNDLADGPFNEKTWQTILSTIISYELVLLSKFTPPSDTPEDII